MISERRLGWIAGFLEGEGSFIWFGDSHYEISCSQVQREPLARLQEMCEGKIYACKPSGPRSQIPYKWSLGGPRAIQWMMTLYPLMSPRRREQIKRVITNWRKLPGQGHHDRTKKQCRRGHPFTIDNIYTWPKHPAWRYCRTCQKLCGARRTVQRRLLKAVSL